MKRTPVDIPDEIPAHRGTYVLLLSSANSQHPIRIGALGVFTFSPGFYVYVGSAFGPGGLRARLQRHITTDKKRRWHIDYLRNGMEIVEVWWSTQPEKLECHWANLLSEMLGSNIPVQGLGSSDCGCTSHLIWFREKPSFSSFRLVAGNSVRQLAITG